MTNSESHYRNIALKSHVVALGLKKGVKEDTINAVNFEAGFNAGWNARGRRDREVMRQALFPTNIKGVENNGRSRSSQAKRACNNSSQA